MTCRMMIDDSMMSWFNHCQIVINDSKYGFKRNNGLLMYNISLYSYSIMTASLTSRLKFTHDSVEVVTRDLNDKICFPFCQLLFCICAFTFSPAVNNEEHFGIPPFSWPFPSRVVIRFLFPRQPKGEKNPSCSYKSISCSRIFCFGLYYLSQRMILYSMIHCHFFSLNYEDNTVVLISDFH